MIIDEKRLFFMALLKGSVRLVAILALLIVIITPIGMVYEYFDFYPQILNEFEYHDYPENYFIRCFLTGFMSLPIINRHLYCNVCVFSSPRFYSFTARRLL